MADVSNISLASDVVLDFGSFHVTNAALEMTVITLMIVGLTVLLRTRLSLVPGRFQVAMEGLIVFLDDLLMAQFVNKKLARRLLPYMVSLFLFIFIANQFSLLPLLQSLVVGDKALFRSVTSDLTFPLTMAMLGIGMSQVIVFYTKPLGHLGDFIKIVPLLKSRSVMDLFMNGIDFFIGILDIVGECAKVISLSVRLFGNVLAGELMILIISSLAFFTAYLIPIPFYILSIFSGVVQTLVFTMLSIAFISNTVNSVSEESAHA